MPVYTEDVLYAIRVGTTEISLFTLINGLDSSRRLSCNHLTKMRMLQSDEAAGHVGCATSLDDGPIGFTDLLTETDARVSLLSYLRSVFPKDWFNFLERISCSYQEELQDTNQITGEEFLAGGALYQSQTELLLWASHRGQLLARTVRRNPSDASVGYKSNSIGIIVFIRSQASSVLGCAQIRGMMAYEKALKLIGLLENPCPNDISDEEYNCAVEDLVSSKYRCVVAAQVYGSNKKGKSLKQKWDCHAVNLLLAR